MMVYQDSAQLNFPKEKMVSCYADHSQIAKLRRGESGAYPDIKRAIKQALWWVVEEQANVGLSRLQLPLGVKAGVEERSRHNGDDIKGSIPGRTLVPAGESRLDDAQSQGSSIPEPQGKTADVLLDKDVVSAPSPLASDGRKDGVIFQIDQGILDHTVAPPGTEAASLDGEELPKGNTEALEPSMQRATDASSNRKNAVSSAMKKKNPDKAMGRVTDTTLRTALCSASKEGNVEKVRSLLAQGCSIHESSEDFAEIDRDAFLLAARNGRLDVLKVLFEYGCDASKRSVNGNTALHLIGFDPEIKPKPVIESLVVLLLEHGVPLEARNADGDAALILSAYFGEISIAECLLDYGADIHSTGKAGHTALHFATEEGHYEIVALLILKGANIHSTNNNSHTALHWAAQRGHYKIVALLISKGADIHSTNNYGWTPLHLAAQKGHHEIVALLISKGAPLEARIRNPSYTPLHISCFAGNDSGRSARLLLQAGADKEAISGFDSQRALHIATLCGNLEVVNELLAFGVEIDAADSDGWRALHYAKRRGHWRILEALLANDANPWLLNIYGERPSRTYWNSGANVSPEDKEKCLNLLKDASEKRGLGGLLAKFIAEEEQDARRS